MKVITLFLISLVASAVIDPNEPELPKEQVDIIKCFLKSERLFQDLQDFIKVVQDRGDVFGKLAEVMPNIMSGLRNCLDGELNSVFTTKFNKPTHEIVSCILRSQILFEDIAKLIEAIETKKVMEIVCTVFEIIPDFIRNIKRCISDEPQEEKINYDKFNSRTTEIVKCFLRSQKLFDDLAKFIDVIATKDKIEIVCTLFEIIPDFIRGIHKCMQL